jgi:hypothetical protein
MDISSIAFPSYSKYYGFPVYSSMRFAGLVPTAVFTCEGGTKAEGLTSEPHGRCRTECDRSKNKYLQRNHDTREQNVKIAVNNVHTYSASRTIGWLSGIRYMAQHKKNTRHPPCVVLDLSRRFNKNSSIVFYNVPVGDLACH